MSEGKFEDYLVSETGVMMFDSEKALIRNINLCCDII